MKKDATVMMFTGIIPAETGKAGKRIVIQTKGVMTESVNEIVKTRMKKSAITAMYGGMIPAVTGIENMMIAETQKSVMTANVFLGSDAATIYAKQEKPVIVALKTAGAVLYCIPQSTKYLSKLLKKTR